MSHIVTHCDRLDCGGCVFAALVVISISYERGFKRLSIEGICIEMSKNWSYNIVNSVGIDTDWEIALDWGCIATH